MPHHDASKSVYIYLSFLPKANIIYLLPKILVQRVCPNCLTSCNSSKAFLTFHLKFLAFYEKVHQFQKGLNPFINFYGPLFSQNLSNSAIFQSVKVHKKMEYVCNKLFYRICLLAAIITSRLLILNILYGDES